MARCRPPTPDTAAAASPARSERGTAARRQRARRPRGRARARRARAARHRRVRASCCAPAPPRRPSQYRPRALGRLAGMAGRAAAQASASASRSDGFQTLMLLMCAGYALVLVVARRLPVAGARGGDRGRARDPAARAAADLPGRVRLPRRSRGWARCTGSTRTRTSPPKRPTDPVFPFVGWPFQHSPYGPLFTLAQLRARAAGAGRRAVGVQGARRRLEPRRGRADRAAPPRALGRSAELGGRVRRPEPGAAGAGRRRSAQRHAAAAGAGAGAGADAPARPRGGLGIRAPPRAALAAGVGVKVTAGLVLPFLVLASPRCARARAGGAGGACAALLAVALVGLLGFGAHALGFLNAVGEQQQLVATHSVPAETARLVGLSGTPSWWRHLYRRRLPRGARVRAVAHRARRGLARGGRLEHDRAAGLDGVAAAVVRDLGAAASGRQRRSAPARRHAPALRLRGPHPPAACRPAAQPRRPPRRRARARRASPAFDTASNSPVSRSFATSSSISAGEASGRSRRRRIASRRLNLRISSTYTRYTLAATTTSPMREHHERPAGVVVAFVVAVGDEPQRQRRCPRASASRRTGRRSCGGWRSRCAPCGGGSARCRAGRSAGGTSGA